MRISKKQLEMIIDSVPEHPNPRIELEQYNVPGPIAATMLWIAEFKYGDIHNSIVADLGCGTGRLAIGAAILGAKHVIGVDIDIVALQVARESAYRLNVDHVIDWINCDVLELDINVDVVVQNPPFGVQKQLRHMDVKFLLKAMEIAKRSIYTLHKSNPKTRALLEKLIKEHGGKISEILKLKFDIKPTYEKHRKRHYVIDVDMYRICLEG
ncbi:MAG: hypothetical protein DRJ66_00455 [Thermoprotei archaeon]|nr:MAG: hypothetical protein DRJ66_00455 [Thermoprotei archaeon]RLF20403.1 MAG: hypothetical protein DRZ82_02465 [Thermoprotei archaeon]